MKYDKRKISTTNKIFLLFFFLFFCFSSLITTCFADPINKNILKETFKLLLSYHSYKYIEQEKYSAEIIQGNHSIML